MIKDLDDISQLYKLPQYYKDLAQIIKYDCEFSLDESNVDHQKFIEKYKDIIGVDIKYPDIVENKDTNIAIKYICYRQAIYCYEHLLKHKPHDKLTEGQQVDYEVLVKRENEIVLGIHNIEDLDSMGEDYKLSREIIISYFISYSENKFINPSKAYYPR